MTGPLPQPSLSAIVSPPTGAESLGTVSITYDANPIARIPGAERRRRARRACHCTSCGAAGHNSRSPYCPARSVP